jgi:hypothetical protein
MIMKKFSADAAIHFAKLAKNLQTQQTLYTKPPKINTFTLLGQYTL